MRLTSQRLAFDADQPMARELDHIHNNLNLLQLLEFKVVAENYTLTQQDKVVVLTQPSLTIKLPRIISQQEGWYCIIKDESGSAGHTIETIGDVNIDGSSTLSISTNYGVKHIYFRNEQYYTLV